MPPKVAAKKKKKAAAAVPAKWQRTKGKATMPDGKKKTLIVLVAKPRKGVM